MIPAKLDDRIDTALLGNPHLAGQKLHVKTDAGRVVLEGTVGTYFQKQMAQEMILRIDGVTRIENRLRVR